MVIIMTCIFWGNNKRRAARFVRKQTEPTTRWHLTWINWGIWKQKWVSLTCWDGEGARERERNKNGMEWGYSYIICKKIAIWQGFLTKTSSTYGYSSQLGIGKLKELRRLDCTTTQCRGKSIWARAIWVFRVPKCVGQKRRWNTGFPEHRLPQIIILFLFIFLGDIYRS